MKDIVVGMGEALFDCLPEGKKIGGAPANFAYHVSQFGFKSCVVSAVGNDEDGDEIMLIFNQRNLNTLIERVPFPTGTVQVTLDEKGVPSYEIKKGVAWDNIPFTDELKELAHNARAVCFGSLAQRNAVSHDTIVKFLDEMPQDDDTLKINDEELELVSRMFGFHAISQADKCWILLAKYGLKMLILTCGVDGSYVFTPGKVSFQPTPRVAVADTVGAGDSFTGAFTAAILAGKPVEEAHELAVAVSAFVCTQSGAMPVLPDELKKRLQ